eukprot:6789595-Alexandrium_andersonii.AAC.1
MPGLQAAGALHGTPGCGPVLQGRKPPTRSASCALAPAAHPSLQGGGCGAPPASDKGAGQA